MKLLSPDDLSPSFDRQRVRIIDNELSCVHVRVCIAGDSLGHVEIPGHSAVYAPDSSRPTMQ